MCVQAAMRMYNLRNLSPQANQGIYYNKELSLTMADAHSHYGLIMVIFFSAKPIQSTIYSGQIVEYSILLVQLRRYWLGLSKHMSTDKGNLTLYTYLSLYSGHESCHGYYIEWLLPYHKHQQSIDTYNYLLLLHSISLLCIHQSMQL